MPEPTRGILLGCWIPGVRTADHGVRANFSRSGSAGSALDGTGAPIARLPLRRHHCGAARPLEPPASERPVQVDEVREPAEPRLDEEQLRGVQVALRGE